MWSTLEALRLHLYKREGKEYRDIQGSNCSLHFVLHRLSLDHDTDIMHYLPHLRHLPMGWVWAVPPSPDAKHTAQCGKNGPAILDRPIARRLETKTGDDEN